MIIGSREKGKLTLCHEIFSDPERKPIFMILKELLYLLLLHRELPKHYFSSYLFKEDISGVEYYLPVKYAARIVPRFNKHRLKEILDNKLYFSLFYERFNIAIPKTVLFNHGSFFILDNRIIRVDNVQQFLLVLEEAFTKHPELECLFVKKIYSSSKGENIYRITRNQVESKSEDIGNLLRNVMQSEYIYQEAIRQHPALNILNPASLNTIRIDSFIDEEGNINVLSGYIRMSMDNNYVDNIGSGGCYVGIDIDSGRMKKFSYSDFKRDGVLRLTSHPVTGTVFDGIEIPYMQEIKELVMRAASMIPGLRLIGWDVAIGPEGPVLIEGNSDYGIRGNDHAYGGYLSHPVLKNELRRML